MPLLLKAVKRYASLYFKTLKNMHKHFKLLLLLLAISFTSYIIVILDLLLLYEIFIDIILVLTLWGAIGLLAVTINEIFKYKQLPKTLLSITFIILSGSYILTYEIRNGAFAGPKYLDAAFLDDRSRMDLTLYENGKFVIYSNWLFGEDRYDGIYHLKGDTIVFDKYPVLDNDFISKEILINRTENKIYFRKNKDGIYDESFYYFQIDK
jgi:hypothetical protein